MNWKPLWDLLRFMLVVGCLMTTVETLSDDGRRLFFYDGERFRGFAESLFFYALRIVVVGFSVGLVLNAVLTLGVAVNGALLFEAEVTLHHYRLPFIAGLANAAILSPGVQANKNEFGIVIAKAEGRNAI